MNFNLLPAPKGGGFRMEGYWVWCGSGDEPILPTRPGHYDSFLTSNPAPYIREDGSVLLIYKARQYEGHDYGTMTIGAAEAPRDTGPYRVISQGTVFSPDTFHIEDSFIWKTADGYALIAKDMDGNLCGEKYGGLLAYSKDGKNGFRNATQTWNQVFPLAP